MTGTFNSLGVLPMPTPGRRIHNALQTLNGIGPRLRALKVQHSAAVGKIRDEVGHDPKLTAEGRHQVLRERIAAAGERGLAELLVLKAETERAQNDIAEAIEANWPKPTPGVEGMLARQAAWARSRSLLESGISVSALIGETDNLETLFALREELPTWVRTRGADAASVERVLERLELRMGKLGSGDAQGEVDLMAKFEARAIVAGLAPMLDLAQQELTSRDGYAYGLHAAISSQYARQAADAANLPILKPDGTIL